MPFALFSGERRLAGPITRVALITALGLTAFQISKHLLFLRITLWQSHVATVVAVAVFSGLAAYFVRRHQASAGKEALRESAEKYRSLVLNIPDIAWTADAKGRIVFISPSIERWSGYTPNEICSRADIRTVSIHPDDLAGVNHAYSRLFTEKQAYDVEYRVRRKDGEWRWVHDRAFACYEKNGMKYADGLLSDITERKEAEEALRWSEFRFRRLVDSNIVGVFSGDHSGRIVEANHAFLNMFGYSAEDLQMGRVRWDRMTPSEYEHFNARVYQQLSTSGASAPEEVEYIRKDGSRFPALVGLASLDESAGRAIGFLVDLTPRKRAEEAMRKAKEAAEDANRAKSEFLANMSHEIRTPMNGILGMTELALETDLNGEQREYLDAVKMSADSLLRIINDILDFSKIRSGKFELEPIEFNPHDTLDEVIRAFSLRAAQKGLELVCEVGGVPDRVAGDPTRLRQILVNLLGNAIKFTERGEVLAQVEVESRDRETVTLHFAIRDTGIGIPAEERQRVFEAFQQADTSSTRRFGGTGLGLTVSARLVEMMGGRIWLESEEGKGSIFHFTARLGVASPSAQAAAAPETDLDGMPVLVVDDNATNRRILGQILSGWKAKPEFSSSAEEALAAMGHAREVNKPFSLVLADCHLPGVDGFELVQRIKRTSQFAGTTIMMLTSAGEPGDAARCRQLGVAAYLAKPVRQSELKQAILWMLGRVLRPAGAVQVVTPRPLWEGVRTEKPLRILLAEDNVVNQVVARRVLEKCGHQVVVVGDGRAVLSALENGHFDLILMDVQMPEMDGLEATHAVRAREKKTGGHIPIVAMTAYAMEGDRERCLAAGMDSYVAKPVQVRELCDAVAAVALAIRSGSAERLPLLPEPPISGHGGESEHA